MVTLKGMQAQLDSKNVKYDMHQDSYKGQETICVAWGNREDGTERVAAFDRLTEKLVYTKETKFYDADSFYNGPDWY